MLFNKKHIIARSPLRISLVGGGTDIETYYSQNNEGHVVSAAIDLYSYVTIKDMFDANTRVHHAEIETEPITSRIRHNYARTALEHFGIFRGVEVILTSDVMTTGSGLGASSAMMSSLIICCNELRKRYQVISKNELAEYTFELEKLAGTIGGKQDQYATVFGGLNSIKFRKDGVEVRAVKITDEAKLEFEDRLFLIFTNLARDSKNIQLNLISNVNSFDKRKYLDELKILSFEFLKELESETINFNSLGKILHEAWMLKKKSNSDSTNIYIEQLYETLRTKGVIGGKILGAGGGGFFLGFVAEPESKNKIKYELYPNFLTLDIRLNNIGTEILWKNF